MMKLFSLLTAPGPLTPPAQTGTSPQNGLFASLLSLLRTDEDPAGDAPETPEPEIEARIAEAEVALSDPDLSDEELGAIIEPLISDLAHLLAAAPEQLAGLRATLPETEAPVMEPEDAAVPDWRAFANVLPALKQMLVDSASDGAETGVGMMAAPQGEALTTLPVPAGLPENDAPAALQRLVAQVVDQAMAMQQQPEPQAPLNGVLSESAPVAAVAGQPLRETGPAPAARAVVTGDTAPVGQGTPPDETAPTQNPTETGDVVAPATAGMASEQSVATDQPPRVPEALPEASAEVAQAAQSVVPADPDFTAARRPPEEISSAVSASRTEPLRAYRATAAAVPAPQPKIQMWDVAASVEPGTDRAAQELQAGFNEAETQLSDLVVDERRVTTQGLTVFAPAVATVPERAVLPVQPPQVVGIAMTVPPSTTSPGETAPPVAVPVVAPLGAVPVMAPAPLPQTTNAPQALPTSEQVLGQVRAQLSDDGQIRIVLKPEGLGRLEIDLRPDDSGQLRVAVRAEQPSVLSLLRADRDGLLTVLRDGGHQVDARGLSFSDLGARDPGQGQPQTQGQGGNGSMAGFAHAETGEVAETEPDRIYVTLPQGGVDIQV